MPLKIKHSLHAKIFYIQTITISLIALCLIVGISYAWNAPTQSPPNGNVATPLNVGPITQTKSGGLNINGNVGIGTTNPKAKLDVIGRIIFGDSSLEQARLYRDSGWLHIQNLADNYDISIDGPLHIRTGGPSDLSDDMIVNSVGNVGIGTSWPSQKLTVNGNVSANDYWINSIGKWASSLGGSGGLPTIQTKCIANYWVARCYLYSRNCVGSVCSPWHLLVNADTDGNRCGGVFPNAYLINYGR